VFIICLSILYSCNKVENSVETQNGLKSTKSNARVTNGFDTLDYLMNIDNPTRDVRNSLKNGGTLPATKAIKIGDNPKPQLPAVGTQAVTPTYPNYHCCNDICLTIPEDPYSFYAPFNDYWGNPIKFIGRYGSDPRQMYYVYIPNNVSSSAKIIVLIHGGGWTTGPDPNKVNGFNSTYCNEGTESTNNIVMKLLSDGYVVVAPLYRLVAGAGNDADDLLTTVTVLDQVNDIDAAITHIHNNFPTCLWQTGSISANNIQVLGESAGANLALLYAYTKVTNTNNYVKSVVSVAGPADMNNFAVWIKNKQLLMPCLQVQNSLNDYKQGDPIAYPTKVHFPKYTIYDPYELSNSATLNITNITNPQSFNCMINIIKNYAGQILGIDIYAPATNPTFPPGTPNPGQPNVASDNINKRVNDAYHVAQCCVKNTIPTPATDNNLKLISPFFVLNAAVVEVPTFIIHGNNDWVVPYTIATQNISASLSANGGLIGIYNSSAASNTAFNNINFATQTSKHIIKTYSADGTSAFSGHANHNVAQHLQTQGNIFNWFNQH
jgi:acetyl esterase/lipase